MPTGYFKVDRAAFDHEMFKGEPFDKFHAWIWLIGHANYKDESRVFNKAVVEIKRGQLVTSTVALAEAWGWSRNKVVRFLRQLTEQQMIQQTGTPHGTTLTVANYEFYQGRRTTNGTTDGTTNGTTNGTHYKNINNINNPKKRARAREGGAAAEWARWEDREK